MNLFETIVETAGTRSSQPAIVTHTGTTSYLELLERTGDLTQHFTRSGIGPGQVVASVLPDDASFLVALLATASVRATFVPVEWTNTSAEVQLALRRFEGAYHLIGNSTTLANAEFEHASRLVLDGCRVIENQLSSSIAPIDELEGTCIVQLTSGSTGEPKGIMVSDAAMLARVRHLTQALELSQDERTLCAIPLSHSHGIDCLALPTLISGGQLHLHPPAAAAPNTVLSIMEERGITFFSSVPTFYDLAAKLLRSKKYDLSKLRRPFCGSAALSSATAHAFLETFGVAILQGYGLAEIGPVTLNLDAASTGRFDSIGSIMPGVEYRIEDNGELVVRSTSMASGYFRQPELWRENVRDGELYTRDIVREDETGKLFLIGRLSNMMHVDGQKVYPAEIEEVISLLDWVKEAAVVGEDDGVRGERIVAHVVLMDDATHTEAEATEALITHIRKKLSSNKHPKRFVFHASLPKSPLGKVLPNLLKGMNG